MSYISILTDDRNAISYRPKLRELTGSVTATILFQQILYWWEKMGRRPFYKFIEPCQHEKYKEGDSWSEELGFSRQEFTTAIKRIGKKITKGTSKKKVFGNHMIIYWTDASRVTWFQVNEELVETKLRYLYNSRNSNYLETEESTSTQEIEEPCVTFSSETTTETTPKTTTNGADAPAQPEPVQEPKPKKKATGKNALKAELVDFFMGVTGLPMLPLNTARQRKEAGVKWFSPVLEVAGWCDGDPDEAKAIIGAAVARLREINYTISSPKSIINVARDEYAKRNGGGNAPTPKLSAAGTYGPVACAAGLGDTITAADFTDEELGRCNT